LFLGFELALLGHGGLALGSSKFQLMTEPLQKMLLTKR